MTTPEIVKLVMESSDSNPYSGKLLKKDNILAAINLANFASDFAAKGQMAEAMYIGVKQWDEVVRQLEYDYNVLHRKEKINNLIYNLK